jgi:hypothetical protein
MPKFAKEFGGQNRNLDPTLPAKKRLPQVTWMHMTGGPDGDMRNVGDLGFLNCFWLRISEDV